MGRGWPVLEMPSKQLFYSPCAKDPGFCCCFVMMPLETMSSFAPTLLQRKHQGFQAFLL